MSMKLRHTLPPAAAPLQWVDLFHGLLGLFKGDRETVGLEKSLKEYLGVKHVFCVNSGKTALTLILMALQKGSPRKEVVIPAYTCFSVPAAVLRAGLKPRLCDINEKTFDFDYDQLAQVMGQDTLCVVPGHLFGIATDLDRLHSKCEAQGALLVEDAAQALGGRQQNRFLGTIGDVGFYSLGRGKTITCGEGGIIVTDSDAIAQAITEHYAALGRPSAVHALIELLKTFLMVLLIRPSLYWIPASIPMLKLGQTFFNTDFPMARLSSAGIGMMARWRERLMQALSGRTEVTKYFQKQLNLSGLQAQPVAFLRLPLIVASRESRDALFNRSQRLGLGLSLMYPSTLNDIPEVHDPNGHFPGAQAIVDCLLALPTHEHVSQHDRQAICHLIGSRIEQERAQFLRPAQV